MLDDAHDKIVTEIIPLEKVAPSWLPKLLKLRKVLPPLTPVKAAPPAPAG